MSDIRFDDKVVVITGAGNGLGKCYAKMFASRGAKVVVNDLGGNVHGEGESRIADDVVKEIGENAVANYDSVLEGEKIIKTAMDTYGRIDVLVNNAGIVRDITFNKMEEKDWDMVVDCHLKGTYATTKAAWNIFREQQYGRVINTVSGVGIYGAFGQSNYSAAKLGVHGLTQSLAKEGESRNIHVNSIAPIAGTRMTETVLAKDLIDALKPEYVAALVAYLAHEDCEETGSLFEVGAGYVAKVKWQRTPGKSYDFDKISPEAIAADWEQITDFSKPESPETLNDTLCEMMNNVERNQTSGSEDPESEFKYKAEFIFAMMMEYLSRGEGDDLVKKVASTYQFNIKETKKGKVVGSWAIDLKSSPPKCYKGALEKPDATFTMIDDDFFKV